MKSDGKVKYFTANDAGEDVLAELRVYGIIKSGKVFTFDEIQKASSIFSDILDDKIRLFAAKKVVEIRQNNGDMLRREISCREADGKGFLGISFEGENCSMVVLDSRGEVSRKEKLHIPELKTLRGRVGEIKSIVKTVAKTTSFRGIPLRFGGVVIHGAMEGKEKKGIAIVAEGLSKIFKCDMLVARRATAAAYAEKHQNPATKEKNMLFLHTDSGEGVLIDGERITESRAPEQGKESYLRAWDQFDAVSTAKDLVKKGVGTDIVGIVTGDVAAISMAEVLVASEKGDELALELVKRSALALGVRSAYLVNIFDVDIIVLGGGIERPEGGFNSYMKESFNRFLLNKNAGKIEIIGGFSGEEVYSLGAALLCRREMFTEVQ